MLKCDKVDFLTGYIWSNVLLASYQPAIRSGTLLISANAGPHQIAGSQCAPNFFSASWQNDQTPEAMGKFMQDQNMDGVYLITPDHAAGRDMMTGFKRYFKTGSRPTPTPNSASPTTRSRSARSGTPIRHRRNRDTPSEQWAA